MIGVLGTSTIFAAHRAALQKKGGETPPHSRLQVRRFSDRSPAIISGIIVCLSLVTRPGSLFVYGTLRRGGKRHDILQRLGAVYAGQGSVAGELVDLGEYPGALRSNSSVTRVIGEVYRLPKVKAALRTLDEYEGVGAVTSLYRREIAEVTLETGKHLSAWIYWLKQRPPRGRRIESGDYAGLRKQ